MSKKREPVKRSRREFLKGAAVVGGAATLAVVAKGGAADVQDANKAVTTPEKSKGYHETPHIRAYYEKARA
ncbi:MAG: twin-arginine translocation signal domain-containing protein [Acidiferrobacterales bacterium]